MSIFQVSFSFSARYANFDKNLKLWSIISLQIVGQGRLYYIFLNRSRRDESIDMHILYVKCILKGFSTVKHVFSSFFNFDQFHVCRYPPKVPCITYILVDLVETNQMIPILSKN